MTLLQAMEASMKGETIVSNTGRKYTPKELNVQRLGKEAVVYNSCGITKEEGKGEWKTV